MGAVEVHPRGVIPGAVELVEIADDPQLPAVRTPPDGERDPPVPLAGEAPVPQVQSPVVLAGLSGPVRIPLDGLDLLEHLRLQVRHLQEPLLRGPEEDRRLAAPAVPVSVRDHFLREQESEGGQVLDDLRRALPRREAAVLARLVREHAPLVDRAEGRESELLSQVEVLGAVSGRRMDAPRALGRYGVR